MDDPFVTGYPPALDDDLPPMLALPTSSPSQLKRTLQAHLAETRRRLESAGQLGRDLVQQEQDIEARLADIAESGDQLDPDLKRKLAELEKEYNDVGRETARAMLTNKIMGGGGGASPFGGSNMSTPPSLLQGHGSSSPAKLGVPSSRRQRNQPSRQNDLEFATELGQGLIAEVRKLQGLLSTCEESLKTVTLEKSQLEQHVESLESRLKSLDESEQRYKEENWNLELIIQDLHSQQSKQRESETRLQTQIAQLGHEKNMIIRELDDTKNQHAQISEELDLKYKHHDAEMTAIRRTLAANESDRVLLQKKVEELKQEMDEARQSSLRLRLQQQQQRQMDGEARDPLDLGPPEDDTPEHSPPPSPVKQTPRHGALESETLKSSLHHAHRMITNLKSNIHREKTEKAELKRLLQDTRDELESARNGFGPPGSGKRRKGDGTFKKLARFNAMLGGARKSRDSVHVLDDEWEETQGDSPEAPQRQPPGAYISSVPPTDLEGEDSAFETANEKETTDAFETANEQDATETEAYRTGIESPINDSPTSADDTETESRSVPVLRTKNSALSHRSNRQIRVSRSRPRLDSVASTASTEDEYEDRNRRFLSPDFESESDQFYPADRYGDELGVPMATNNPRLKLRINRNRSRGSRIGSGTSSIFNNASFMDNGSSPPSMDDNSPQGFSRPMPAIRKSLFAELGDSPGMMDTDEGTEDETAAEEIGTPTRISSRVPSYSARKPEMVESGMMTEEPYPEVPILLHDSDSSRPRTAVTVVGEDSFMHPHDLMPTFAKKAMSDAGIQSEEEFKPAGIEMGTQSDELPSTATSESGTQFDPDLETPPLTAVMASKGWQTESDLEIERSTTPQVAPEPSKPLAVFVGTAAETIPEAIRRNPSSIFVGTAAETIPQIPPPKPREVPMASTVFMGTAAEIVPETIRRSPSSIFIGTAAETIPQAPAPKPREVPMASTVFMSTTAETLPQSPPPKQPEVLPQPPKPTTVYVGTTAETLPQLPKPVVTPVIPLSFSSITSVATEPMEPKPVTPAGVLVPAPVGDGALSSDEDTPKKVSDSVEGRESAPVTPEKKGFFASIFGGRSGSDEAGKRKGTISRASSVLSVASSKHSPVPSWPHSIISTTSPDSKSVSNRNSGVRLVEDGDNEETIRKKDTRRSRLAIPVSMSNQSMQTDISSDDIDKLSQDTKKAAVVADASETARPITPSIRSRTSTESMGRGKGRTSAEGIRFATGGATVKRPGSSGSMREMRHSSHPPLPPNHQEQIAAAQQQKLQPVTQQDRTLMGPPPVPTNRTSPAVRPRTPAQDRRPETPGSRTNHGQPRARFSSIRSEISSPTSRRSSLSSFASEIDGRFNMESNGFTPTSEPQSTSTDPRVIQAITQTMIGEYLWKYTRTTTRSGLSTTRHRRFFWVHPYTRTLYWSDRDPQTAGRNELHAKSVAIEAVRVVTDDNPMPPGLHRKSLIVVTPGRTLKFTAPTSARHETWFNALSYLLLRTGEQVSEDRVLDGEDIRDYNPYMRGAGTNSTRNSSPSRNTSALSNRRDGSMRLAGSISRLSNIFRSSSALGTYSSRHESGSLCHAEESEDDDHGHHHHGHNDSGTMENVRACCDGKHDVGTLSRRGGRKSMNNHRSRHSIHERNHSHG